MACTRGADTFMQQLLNQAELGLAGRGSVVGGTCPPQALWDWAAFPGNWGFPEAEECRRSNDMA